MSDDEHEGEPEERAAHVESLTDEDLVAAIDDAADHYVDDLWDVELLNWHAAHHRLWLEIRDDLPIAMPHGFSTATDQPLIVIQKPRRRIARLLTVIVALAVVAGCASTAASGPSPLGEETARRVEPPSDAPSTEEASDSGELVAPGSGIEAAFPDYLVEDLQYLQIAIDYRFDRHMTDCLNSQGWEVSPPSLDAIVQFNRELVVPRSAVQEAMEVVAGRASAQEPTPSFLASLDEGEFAAFERDSNQCHLDGQHLLTNPMGPSGVLAGFHRSTSDRVQASGEFQRSRQEAELCFSESGFDRSELAEINNEAVRILAEFEDGLTRKSPQQTLSELEILQDREALVEGVEADCFASHRESTQALFNEYLTQAILEDPSHAFIVAELEEFVGDLRAEIDATALLVG